MHFMKFYQKTHEEGSQLPVPPHSQVPLSAHPTLDKRRLVHQSTCAALAPHEKSLLCSTLQIACFLLSGWQSTNLGSPVYLKTPE